MAKNSVNLFINALSVFNQDRYKSDAALAARFANLTEADVAVSNVTVDSGTDVVTATVKSATRAFEGTGQSFKRAKLMHPEVTTYTQKTLNGVTDQASFLDAIKHIDTAGVYAIAVPELSGAEALVVIHPPIDDATDPADVEEVTQDAVLATLAAAMEFTFEGTPTVATVGSTYQYSDNYIKDVVYHAPVGAAMLTIPATDYGNLDDTQYLATI